MVEINLSKNIYPYGKFYDASRVSIPTDEDNWDVIIYAQPLCENSRIIGSLEGLFVSEVPLIKKETEKAVRKDWNPLVKREQMEKFEEKYQGKFIPFEK